MRVLVVYAHPYKKSFNYKVLKNVVAGLKSAKNDVKIKNLYEEAFDPVLSEKDLAMLQTGVVPPRIQQEQDALSWAEGVIFIYPLWWLGTPAILKGWFDCTLTYGYAFNHSQGDLQGLLPHKKALVIISAGNKEEWFKSHNAQDIIHRPVTQGTLAFCGIKNIDLNVLYDTSAQSDTERNETLATLYTIGKLFSEEK
jgi:NAD(P)H dehydrogenase (quinone)